MGDVHDQLSKLEQVCSSDESQNPTVAKHTVGTESNATTFQFYSLTFQPFQSCVCMECMYARMAVIRGNSVMQFSGIFHIFHPSIPHLFGSTYPSMPRIPFRILPPFHSAIFCIPLWSALVHSLQRSASPLNSLSARNGALPRPCTCKDSGKRV